MEHESPILDLDEEGEAVDGTTETVAGTEELPTIDHVEQAAESPIAEIALLLALLIVIIGGWRPVKRAVTGMLDARSERIRSELGEAQRLREEAQAALATYQRRQRDALDEAKRILEHARSEAATIRTQALAALEVQLKRREELALARIAQAEQAAAAEVRNAAVDVAVAAARQVFRDGLDETSGAALVDQAIAELPARLH